MSKAMSNELRKEVRSSLGALVNAEPGTFIFINLATPDIDRDAINYLNDIGALQDIGTGTYRLTACGREYWDRLNTPTPVYWCKQNWFPAIVAAATIAASMGGIIVNALD